MKKLLNTKEAADYLGLKLNTLEIWRCKARGPSYKKMGRRVLYNPDELAEYIAACTVGSNVKHIPRLK